MSDRPGRRTDRRLTALLCIALLMGLALLFFHVVEQNTFCGLAVQTESSIRARESDKTFLEAVDNADALISFDGNGIPWDRSTNTFYIPQDVGTEIYTGQFATVPGVRAVFLEEARTRDKREDIRTGRRFRLWLSTAHTSTICGVVFTGLPVVVLSVDRSIKSAQGYRTGTLDLWSPRDEDYGTVASRHARITWKKNAGGSIHTIKLWNKTGEAHKRISLLGLGKRDAWKIYTVDAAADPSGLRMMLAWQMWNTVSDGDALNVPCHYAELIENGAYAGLCILRPRTDDDYFRWAGVAAVRDVGDEDPDPALYAEMDPPADNLTDYWLWLQLTGHRNGLFRDLRILKADDRVFLLPDKPWETFDTADLMDEMTLGLGEAELQTLQERCTLRWQALRDAGVYDMTEALQTAWERLADAGAVQRLSLDGQAAECLDVILEERISAMDERYGEQD